MRKQTLVKTLLVAAGVLIGAPLADAAGADPALRCQAAKLAAVRAEVTARITCERRGLSGGSTAACITQAAQRRDAAFSRHEAAGTCSTVGDSAILGDAAASAVSDLREVLLPGGPAPSACTASQLAASRSAIARLIRAHLRDARMPDPVRLAAAVADARTELAARFARAAQRGDCLSASTSAGISDLLEEAAVTFRGMLLGTCPCWTAAAIDAAFPPGYFDANGRGGVVCDAPLPSISAADTCDLFGPMGQVFALPRGGAALIDGHTCLLLPDLDPNDTGTCTGAPTLVSITAVEVAACTARLLASAAYHQLCD